MQYVIRGCWMIKYMQEHKYGVMGVALAVTLLGLAMMAYMMSGATIRAVDDEVILVEKDSDVSLSLLHDKIAVDPETSDYDVVVVSDSGELSVQDHNDMVIQKRKLDLKPKGILVEGDLKLRIFLKENPKRDVFLNLKVEDTIAPKVIVSYEGNTVKEDELSIQVGSSKITAVAKDYAFGSLTESLKVNVKGSIDYDEAGTYELIYSADDKTNQVERKIKVKVLEEDVEIAKETEKATEDEKTEIPNDYDSGTSSVVDSHSELVLVNKHRSLSRDFYPNLSYIPAEYAVSEGYEATPNTISSFVQMVDALYEETGLWLLATSSYRGYDFQEELYTNYVASHGQAQADLMSARPGHSEHQTGLVIDVVTPGGNMFAFSETHQSLWVNRNAHRFGFIVRYQAGKEHITGYQPEAWHLRYVGTKAATEIYNSGLTLDEYLNQ